ncbi:glycosyltransferase [Microbulbifer zhoushanensis]|uniref:glycosyltransferase n=1 Tax=Microbulbifer TaxID=48073 RepID=UPI001F3856C7|nr:glycosyltransferase [Microbulbifer zhoushanensis]
MCVEISIIIPIFEQWKFVPELLNCLYSQSYPMDKVEVVLVDNGSRGIHVPADLPDGVRILHCETPGAYAARNFGVQHSRGEWLVFTDADCLPSRNWLSEIAKAGVFGRCGNEFVAGRVDSIDKESPSVYEIYDMVRGIPQAHYVSRGYAATANLAASRAMINRVGGFNEQLYSGGDADFCRRAGKSGFKIVYVDSAVVRHRTRTSWKEIATKARRVKGGQLTRRTLQHKLWVYFRTIVSPGITAIRLLRNRQFPFKYRVIASFVYLRVWGVELIELIRVALGREPERR